MINHTQKDHEESTKSLYLFTVCLSVLLRFNILTQSKIWDSLLGLPARLCCNMCMTEV